MTVAGIAVVGLVVALVGQKLSGGGTGERASDRLGTWRPIPRSSLAPRIYSSTAWSGKELLSWGGRECVAGRCDQAGRSFADGAAYDPHAGTWRMLAPSPLAARSAAATVWTGREMLIWGGSGPGPLADGAAYDPVTDRWRPLAPAPLGGGDSQAVWSGHEMLTWLDTMGSQGTGGTAGSDAFAAYDPVTDSWRTLSASPLTARSDTAVAWSGREMLVWGGTTGSQYFADGAAYDPTTDHWRRLPPAPLAGRAVQGRWTGTELMIWGGEGPSASFADGAAYDPGTDSWRRLAPAPLSPRRGFAESWTGGELLVWGGAGQTGNSMFGDGAAYDPATDRWRGLARWPGRFIPSTYWTGGEMLVWGGIVPSGAHAGASGVEPTPDGAAYLPPRPSR